VQTVQESQSRQHADEHLINKKQYKIEARRPGGGMADAEDLKSSGDFSSCGFDSHPGYQFFSHSLISLNFELSAAGLTASNELGVLLLRGSCRLNGVRKTQPVNGR
jgi:hypothetical protein